MRRLAALATVVAAVLAPRTAQAQEPPPRIPLFVADLHASVPRFPDDPQLAGSRAMQVSELPGSGLGVQIGVHVYPIRWHAITFGIGGEFATGRSRQSPSATQTGIRGATERFTSLAPQVSFNFGTGHGWSYISGGLATSTWSLVPEGQPPIPPDSDKLKTINYGGGARWFIKTRLAFSFDVRLYAINPGAPYYPGLLGSPRTTLLIIGAGISVK